MEMQDLEGAATTRQKFRGVREGGVRKKKLKEEGDGLKMEVDRGANHHRRNKKDV